VFSASKRRSRSGSAVAGSSGSPRATLSLATQLARVRELIPRSRCHLGDRLARLSDDPYRTSVEVRVVLPSHLLTRCLHGNGGYPSTPAPRHRDHRVLRPHWSGLTKALRGSLMNLQ
jgi:hypothetical protein